MKKRKLQRWMQYVAAAGILLIVCLLCDSSVEASVYRGDCGKGSKDKVTWTLDTDKMTLTISGKGQMRDFELKSGDPDSEHGEEQITEEYHFNKTKAVHIVVEEGITSLGTFAFYSFVDAQTISLPSTLEKISDYTFKNCKSLKEIKIPKNVSYIGKYAFGDCRTITSMTIPEGIDCLQMGCFKDCENLKSVNLPSTLTTLKPNVFLRCERLQSVNLPKGVEEVGDLAFKECTKLKSVTLPATVEKMGSAVFEMCSSLEEVKIPYGIKECTAQMFKDCKNLKTVTLPITIDVIPSTAFENCPNVTIKASTNYIKGFAEKYGIKFKNNAKSYKGLKYVIQNKKAIIVNYDKDISKAEIPEKIDNCEVTTIWRMAFDSCYTLTSVTIPSTVKTIGERAFFNCFDLLEVTNLSKANITKGSEKNGYAGYYAVNIRTNKKNKTVLATNKEGYIFVYMDNKNYLIGYEGNETELKLPSSFTNANGDKVTKYYIYKYALAGRNITGCQISSSITFMGNNIFDGCSKLRSVIVPASVEKIGSDAFIRCHSKFKLSGYSGTFAEKYAKDNKISFNKLKETDIVLELAPSMVSIEYNASEYTGKQVSPKVVVKNGSTVLKKGTDYSVKYVNAKNAGTATVVVKGKGNYSGSVQKTYKIKFIKNHKYKAGDYIVRISKLSANGKSGEAVLVGTAASGLADVNIGRDISFGGGKFKITEIGGNAFADSKNLKSVTIESDIVKIGNRAFYGCSKLTKMKLGSAKLKSVGQNALRQVNKKLVISVPQSKLADYKKLFNSSAGFENSMKIKKG